MNHTYKILQVTAVDITVKSFLLPLIDRLISEGHQVHIACSKGKYTGSLQAQGYIVHTVDTKRTLNMVSHLKTLWCLYRLIKKEQFDIVHVHTPVAAALGRVAAWAAGVPVIIYTVHGFYFHENMPAWKRQLIIFVEKCLGLITNMVLAVSKEDAVTAVRENIYPEDKVTYIGNGVNIKRFANIERNGVRAKFGLNDRNKVIGFVGRIVEEKGVIELIAAMQPVVKAIPHAKLLFVGDVLDSDRDKKTKDVIKNLLTKNGIASNIIFTGFIEDIPRVLKSIDLFVLPSYREGMPVSVIEAMASGIPVIATNIRGCREEVVPGLTGLLVPVKDPAALAIAIISLLADPELCQQMGAEGRRRACELYDERIILDKQIKAYAKIINEWLETRSFAEKEHSQKTVQHWFKRAADIAVSLMSLTILGIPFLVIAALIKIDSTGPVFFRQERIGKSGKSFRVWKFRTMVDGAISHGLGLNVASNDSRITRIGKLLRNWGFDELPQLINILTGEMSIVGPRPTLSYQVEQYNDFQWQRLLVKPGMTSLAVINGRNLLSWDERIKLDVKYVSGWSLWLDLKIIIKTFWAVLVTKKGIYGSGGVNDDFSQLARSELSSTINTDKKMYSQNKGPNIQKVSSK
jgi:lipopolysaccharide/colanic/teichoic acid biosynthesis glycosyltransferase/glycosyltransferase involved in cell wall biosynthesis